MIKLSKKWAGCLVAEGELCAWFWWGNLKERDNSGRSRWEDNFKMDLKERVRGHELDLSG